MKLEEFLEELSHAHPLKDTSGQLTSTSKICDGILKLLRYFLDTEGRTFLDKVRGVRSVLELYTEIRPKYEDQDKRAENMGQQLFLESARLILEAEFTSLPDDSPEKTGFEGSIIELRKNLTGSEAASKFFVLNWLMINQWNHPTLASLMRGEDIDETRAFTYLTTGEFPELFKLRVQMLTENNCDSYALNLAEWCLRCEMFEDDETLTIAKLVLLSKLGKKDEVVSMCMKIPCCVAVKYLKRLKHKKTPHEEAAFLCMSQTVLLQDWMEPEPCCSKDLLKLFLLAERRAETDDAKFVANIEKILQLTQDTSKMMLYLEAVISQFGDNFVEFCSEISLKIVKKERHALDSARIYRKDAEEVSKAAQRLTRACRLIAAVYAKHPQMSLSALLTCLYLEPKDTYFNTSRQIVSKLTEPLTTTPVQPAGVDEEVYAELLEMVDALRPISFHLVKSKEVTWPMMGEGWEDLTKVAITYLEENGFEYDHKAESFTVSTKQKERKPRKIKKERKKSLHTEFNQTPTPNPSTERVTQSPPPVKPARTMPTVPQKYISPPMPKLSPDKTDKFPCSVCCEMFVNNHSLRRHQSSQHPEYDFDKAALLDEQTKENVESTISCVANSLDTSYDEINMDVDRDYRESLKLLPYGPIDAVIDAVVKKASKYPVESSINKLKTTSTESSNNKDPKMNVNEVCLVFGEDYYNDHVKTDEDAMQFVRKKQACYAASHSDPNAACSSISHNKIHNPPSDPVQHVPPGVPDKALDTGQRSAPVQHTPKVPGRILSPITAPPSTSTTAARAAYSQASPSVPALSPRAKVAQTGAQRSGSPGAAFIRDGLQDVTLDEVQQVLSNSHGGTTQAGGGLTMDEDALREITDFLQDGVPGAGAKPGQPSATIPKPQPNTAQYNRLQGQTSANKPVQGSPSTITQQNLHKLARQTPAASRNIPVGVVPSLPEGISAPISMPKPKTRTKADIMKNVKAKSGQPATTVQLMLQQQQAQQQLAAQQQQQQIAAQQQILQASQTLQQQQVVQQGQQQVTCAYTPAVQQQIVQQQVIQPAVQQTTPVVQQTTQVLQQTAASPAPLPTEGEYHVELPNGQFMAVPPQLAQICKEVPGEVIQLETGEVWHVPEGQTLTLPDGRSVTAKSGRPVKVVKTSDLTARQAAAQTMSQPPPQTIVHQPGHAIVNQQGQIIAQQTGQGLIQGQDFLNGQYIQAAQIPMASQAVIQTDQTAIVANPSYQVSTIGMNLPIAQTLPFLSTNVMSQPVQTSVIGSLNTQNIQTMQVSSGGQIIQTPDGQIVQISNVLNPEQNVMSIVATSNGVQAQTNQTALVNSQVLPAQSQPLTGSSQVAQSTLTNVVQAPVQTAEMQQSVVQQQQAVQSSGLDTTTLSKHHAALPPVSAANPSGALAASSHSDASVKGTVKNTKNDPSAGVNQVLVRDQYGKFVYKQATAPMKEVDLNDFTKDSSPAPNEEISEEMGNFIDELIVRQTVAPDTSLLANPELPANQSKESTQFATPINSPLKSPMKKSNENSPFNKGSPGNQSKASEDSFISESDDDSAFRCRFCGKGYDTAEDRRQHQEWFCGKKPKSDAIRPEEYEVISCDICGKEFDTERGLRLHAQRIHNVILEKTIASKRPARIAPPKTTYECPYCNKKLSSRHNVKRHITALHPEVKLDTTTLTINKIVPNKQPVVPSGGQAQTPAVPIPAVGPVESREATVPPKVQIVPAVPVTNAEPHTVDNGSTGKAFAQNTESIASNVRPQVESMEVDTPSSATEQLPIELEKQSSENLGTPHSPRGSNGMSVRNCRVSLDRLSNEVIEEARSPGRSRPGTPRSRSEETPGRRSRRSSTQSTRSARSPRSLSHTGAYAEFDSESEDEVSCSCDNCGQRFYRLTALKVHLEKNECTEYTGDTGDYDYETNTIRTKTVSTKKEHSSRLSTGSNTLSDGMHKDRKEISFENVRMLEIKSTSHMNKLLIKEYGCLHCGSTFALQKNCAEHSLECLDDVKRAAALLEQIKCFTCGQAFHSTVAFEAHMNKTPKCKSANKDSTNQPIGIVREPPESWINSSETTGNAQPKDPKLKKFNSLSSDSPEQVVPSSAPTGHFTVVEPPEVEEIPAVDSNNTSGPPSNPALDELRRSESSSHSSPMSITSGSATPTPVIRPAVRTVVDVDDEFAHLAEAPIVPESNSESVTFPDDDEISADTGTTDNNENKQVESDVISPIEPEEDITETTAECGGCSADGIKLEVKSELESEPHPNMSNVEVASEQVDTKDGIVQASCTEKSTEMETTCQQMSQNIAHSAATSVEVKDETEASFACTDLPSVISLSAGTQSPDDDTGLLNTFPDEEEETRTTLSSGETDSINLCPVYQMDDVLGEQDKTDHNDASSEQQTTDPLNMALPNGSSPNHDNPETPIADVEPTASSSELNELIEPKIESTPNAEHGTLDIKVEIEKRCEDQCTESMDLDNEQTATDVICQDPISGHDDTRSTIITISDGTSPMPVGSSASSISGEDDVILVSTKSPTPAQKRKDKVPCYTPKGGRNSETIDYDVCYNCDEGFVVGSPEDKKHAEGECGLDFPKKRVIKFRCLQCACISPSIIAADDHQRSCSAKKAKKSSVVVPPTPKGASPGVIAWPCTKCRKKFLNINAITQHLITFHKETEAAAKRIIAEAEEKRKETEIKLASKLTHVCEKCEQPFANQKLLNSHKERHCSAAGVGSEFPCSDCDMKFADRVTLREHRQSTHRDTSSMENLKLDQEKSNTWPKPSSQKQPMQKKILTGDSPTPPTTVKTSLSTPLDVSKLLSRISKSVTKNTQGIVGGKYQITLKKRDSGEEYVELVPPAGGDPIILEYKEGECYSQEEDLAILKSLALQSPGSSAPSSSKGSSPQVSPSSQNVSVQSSPSSSPMPAAGSVLTPGSQPKNKVDTRSSIAHKKQVESRGKKEVMTRLRSGKRPAESDGSPPTQAKKRDLRASPKDAGPSENMSSTPVQKSPIAKRTRQGGGATQPAKPSTPATRSEKRRVTEKKDRETDVQVREDSLDSQISESSSQTSKRTTLSSPCSNRASREPSPCSSNHEGEVKHSYTCPHCDTGKTFTKEYSLESHLAWVHGKGKGPSATDQFTCSMCKDNQKFNEADLRCHMKWKHRIENYCPQVKTEPGLDQKGEVMSVDAIHCECGEVIQLCAASIILESQHDIPLESLENPGKADNFYDVKDSNPEHNPSQQKLVQAKTACRRCSASKTIWKCIDCNSFFLFRMDLLLHFKHSHATASAPTKPTRSKSTSTPTSRWKCTICNIAFKSMKPWDNHMSTTHPNTNKDRTELFEELPGRRRNPSTHLRDGFDPSSRSHESTVGNTKNIRSNTSSDATAEINQSSKDFLDFTSNPDKPLTEKWQTCKKYTRKRRVSTKKHQNEEPEEEDAVKIPCIQVAVLSEKESSTSKRPEQLPPSNDDFDKIVEETKAAALKSSPVPKLIEPSILDTQGTSDGIPLTNEISMCEENTVDSADAPVSIEHDTKSTAAVVAEVIPRKRSSRSGSDPVKHVTETPKPTRVSKRNEYSRKSIDKTGTDEKNVVNNMGSQVVESKSTDKENEESPQKAGHTGPDSKAGNISAQPRQLRSSADKDNSTVTSNCAETPARSKRKSTDCESSESGSAMSTRGSVEKATVPKRPSSRASVDSNGSRQHSRSNSAQGVTLGKKDAPSQSTKPRRRTLSAGSSTGKDVIPGGRATTRQGLAKAKLCTRNAAKVMSQKVHLWRNMNSPGAKSSPGSTGKKMKVTPDKKGTKRKQSTPVVSNMKNKRNKTN